MSTLPNPTTVAVGDRNTAALHNELVSAVDYVTRQGSNFFPSANVYNNSTVATTSGTYLLVPFNSESWDTPDAMHDPTTNNSRLVFTQAGLWRVDFGVRWAFNATGYRRVNVRLNSGGSQAGGTSLLFQDVATTTTTFGTAITRGFMGIFAVNDYVEVFALQNSGGNLDLSGGAGQYEVSVSAMMLGGV
jgi:hypothetical protein